MNNIYLKMKVKTSDLIITQFNEFKMLLVNKNEIRLLDLKKNMQCI